MHTHVTNVYITNLFKTCNVKMKLNERTLVNEKDKTRLLPPHVNCLTYTRLLLPHRSVALLVWCIFENSEISRRATNNLNHYLKQLNTTNHKQCICVCVCVCVCVCNVVFFIPHFIMEVITYSWWDWSWTILVKGAPALETVKCFLFVLKSL